MSEIGDPRRAVPQRLRMPVAVAAVTALAGLVMLAVRYRGTGAPGELDRAARDRLAGIDDGTPLERIVPFADRSQVVAAALLLAVVCCAARRRRLAVVAILGPGLTGVATTLLKPMIGRTLDGAPALPSGHTGGATSLAMVAALLLVAMTGTRTRTTIVAVLGVVAIGTLMGVALVAGGFHYASDTVAGFCTAVAVVGVVAIVVDWIADHADGSTI